MASANHYSLELRVKGGLKVEEVGLELLILCCALCAGSAQQAHQEVLFYFTHYFIRVAFVVVVVLFCCCLFVFSTGGQAQVLRAKQTLPLSCAPPPPFLCSLLSTFLLERQQGSPFFKWKGLHRVSKRTGELCRGPTQRDRSMGTAIMKISVV